MTGPGAMLSIGVAGFDSWREAARVGLAKGVAPAEVTWFETSQVTPRRAPQSPGDLPEPHFRVPKPFLELARLVSCYDDRQKWDLLYRVLWRLTHGDHCLLEFRIDDDVYRLHQMAEAVRLDVQRMKTAVRFHHLDHVAGDHYIAWLRPAHRTLRLVAPYFAKRYRSMRWSLLTPDESAYFDGERLQFGAGVRLAQSPSTEQLSELWHTYCREVFQSDHIAWELRSDVALTRHWPMLAEARLADQLDHNSQRTSEMKKSAGSARRSAEDFLPDRPGLAALEQAASCCEGCDLYKNATQTVFGEGPADAKVMLVGEQPGDEEDVTGQPFVGPAGRVLNEALAEVGLDRSEVYVTNAVKHFKNTPRGKRRMHAKPTRTEVLACRAWLESEIMTLEPAIIVCLGATAAQSLMGTDFRITKQRGEVFETEWAPYTIATWHPSAVLRVPDPADRDARRGELIADLQQVVEQLAHV